MKPIFALPRRIAVRLRHRLHDVLLDSRLVLRRRTIIAHARSFPACCSQAADDDGTFAVFKDLPEFRVVIENLTCEQGRGYLDRALLQMPSLTDLLDRVRGNDRVGSPRTSSYGEYGHFSPTTLRYVKVLSDLLTLFGSLDGRRIIEIGGGYGGQCFVTSVAAEPSSYVLVDLDPVLHLQRVYLNAFGATAIDFNSPDDLDPTAEYDLVISNYAFSECVRRVQRYYIDRVLTRSARGYITCNWLRPRMSLTKEQLLAAVPGSRFIPDEPVVMPGTAILVWGLPEPSAETSPA